MLTSVIGAEDAVKALSRGIKSVSPELGAEVYVKAPEESVLPPCTSIVGGLGMNVEA